MVADYIESGNLDGFLRPDKEAPRSGRGTGIRSRNDLLNHMLGTIREANAEIDAERRRECVLRGEGNRNEVPGGPHAGNVGIRGGGRIHVGIEQRKLNVLVQVTGGCGVAKSESK